MEWTNKLISSNSSFWSRAFGTLLKVAGLQRATWTCRLRSHATRQATKLWATLFRKFYEHANLLVPPAPKEFKVTPRWLRSDSKKVTFRVSPEWLFNTPKTQRSENSYFKIRSCAVRLDLRIGTKSAENVLFLRSVLAMQDRILKIRVVSLGSHFWGKKSLLGLLWGTPF